MSCNEWKDTEIGKMPASWDYAPMEEYVEINMGQSPKSEFYNTVGEGLPFLQGNRTFGLKYPYYDTYTSEIKKRAQQGDILFSVRAPVGDVNIATEEICIGRGIASLKMKNGNQEYLYYLLRMYRRHIENRESGTVFGSINKKGLEELKLPFPPLEEQEKIANILSSLDDKIELNNEMNKNLEEMAQSIFKRWFIDFEFPNEDGEPYKSSGGEMVESELGMIPKGWEVKVISNLAKIMTKSEKPFDNEEILYEHFSIPALDNGKLPVFEYGSSISSNKYKIDNECILISKLNPNNKRVWNPHCVTNNSICSTEFIVYKAINNYPKSFLYEIINSDEFSEFLVSNATGSTGSRQRVKPKETLGFKVIIPPIDMIAAINNILEPIHRRVQENIQNSRELMELRDKLLPKLMSGEIQVG